MRFPNESPEYRRAREQLLNEEIELRRHIERVAELRRALPPGGAVTKNYAFEGEGGKATLSDLFGGKQTLVIVKHIDRAGFFDPRGRRCGTTGNSKGTKPSRKRGEKNRVVELPAPPSALLNSLKLLNGTTQRFSRASHRVQCLLVTLRMLVVPAIRSRMALGSRKDRLDRMRGG